MLPSTTACAFTSRPMLSPGLKVYARRGTGLFHPGHHGTGIHRTDAAHGIQVGGEEIDHPLAHQVYSLTRRGEGKHGDALRPLHHRSAASGSEEDPPQRQQGDAQGQTDHQPLEPATLLDRACATAGDLLQRRGELLNGGDSGQPDRRPSLAVPARRLLVESARLTLLTRGLGPVRLWVMTAWTWAPRNGAWPVAIS